MATCLVDFVGSGESLLGLRFALRRLGQRWLACEAIRHGGLLRGGSQARMAVSPKIGATKARAQLAAAKDLGSWVFTRRRKQGLSRVWSSKAKRRIRTAQVRSVKHSPWSCSGLVVK